MSTRAKDPKGDRRTGDSSQPLSASDSPDGDSRTDTRQARLMPTVHNPLVVVVNWFADHDCGALKLRRATDSEDVHLTWTWSISSLAGTYVYTRVPVWQLTYGLELLRTKVLQAEEGTRRPTVDRRARDYHQ